MHELMTSSNTAEQHVKKMLNIIGHLTTQNETGGSATEASEGQKKKKKRYQDLGLVKPHSNAALTRSWSRQTAKLGERRLSTSSKIGTHI